MLNADILNSFQQIDEEYIDKLLRKRLKITKKR